MQNVTEYKLPDDIEHEQFDITRIYHNTAINSVFIEYEDEDIKFSPLQLQFRSEPTSDGTLITKTAVGLVSPDELPDDPQDTWAQSTKKVYEILEQLGFNVEGYNQ